MLQKHTTVKGLTDALRNGVVTVVFDKINDGGRRVMPCTLNSVLSEHNVPEVLEQREDNDHLVVWSIDKKAWRSFRSNTLVEWFEGTPDVPN